MLCHSSMAHLWDI